MCTRAFGNVIPSIWGNVYRGCVELAALASSGLTETVQTGGWSDTQPESWVTVAAAAVTFQQVCSSFSRKWFIWGGPKNITASTLTHDNNRRGSEEH